MRINTTVTELEPDWHLIRFEGSKPPAEQRAFWINRTLTDWLGAHPGRVVTQALPIQHKGQLVAIHVWLDVTRQRNKRRPVRSGAARCDKIENRRFDGDAGI